MRGFTTRGLTILGLYRGRRVKGGRPGPPGCQGRLPFLARIIVRRFRRWTSQNHLLTALRGQ